MIIADDTQVTGIKSLSFLNKEVCNFSKFIPEAFLNVLGWNYLY